MKQKSRKNVHNLDSTIIFRLQRSDHGNLLRKLAVNGQHLSTVCSMKKQCQCLVWGRVRILCQRSTLDDLSIKELSIADFVMDKRNVSVDVLRRYYLNNDRRRNESCFACSRRYKNVGVGVDINVDVFIDIGVQQTTRGWKVQCSSPAPQEERRILLWHCKHAYNYQFNKK